MAVSAEVIEVLRVNLGDAMGHDPAQFMLGAATSTSFWEPYDSPIHVPRGDLGSNLPHTRSVLCSAWCPSSSDADWCLQSDGTYAQYSRLQGSCL